jgi:hypothetical protein
MSFRGILIATLIAVLLLLVMLYSGMAMHGDPVASP